MEEVKVNDNITCVNVNPLEGNDVAPPLEMNKEYPIKQIYICSCGQSHFDVGLESQYNYIRCWNCKSDLPDGEIIHWCHPSRFKN